MRIFHIATLADWQAALASGSYVTSTRGRTLAEEGFIHASRGDQWQGVRQRYYADATEPLVLLSIDTDLLTSPVIDEAVPGGSETFPHIYGPVDPAAVVATIALEGRTSRTAAPPAPAPGSVGPAAPNPAPGSESFSRIFLQEVFRQLVVASLVLALVVGLTLLGLASGLEWGPITGAAVGLGLGVLAARRLSRRRASRTT